MNKRKIDETKYEIKKKEPKKKISRIARGKKESKENVMFKCTKPS
jgi:hypothetical protein